MSDRVATAQCLALTAVRFFGDDRIVHNAQAQLLNTQQRRPATRRR
jgi:hypothetical protein